MARRCLALLGLVALLVPASLGPPWRGDPAPSPAAGGPRLLRLEPSEGSTLLGDGASTKLRAIATALPSVLTFAVSVPTQARMETFLSFARDPPVDLGALTCRARVEVATGSRTDVLIDREVRPGPAWEPYDVDLSGHPGADIQLRLRLDCPGLAKTVESAARWSIPVIASGQGPHLPNLLLVSIDTLRADHLGAYGYERPTSPNIDALAGRGLLFTNGETVQSATWPALTSLHTSLYPSAHGVVWNGHHAPPGLTTLAEVLEADGFSTSAFITNMTRGRHPGFSRLFLSRKGPQAEADRVAVAHATAQLARERNRRFFMWVHLLSPHADYSPPRSLASAFARPGPSRLRGGIEELVALRRSGMALAETDIRRVIDLYDAEVAFVDEQVGVLLRALKENGLEGRTLVVLTADHGEDLYEHNRYFFHSPSIYRSSMHIPLVLSLPGLLGAGERTDHPASLIDVAPTVLGLLGVGIPGTFQGKDLLPAGSVPPSQVRSATLGETAGRIASIRTLDWRLVYNPEHLQPDAPGGPYPISEVELYDQKADPREQHNLAAQRPDLVRALTAELLALRRAAARPGLATPSLDPEALDELRALGYVAQ